MDIGAAGQERRIAANVLVQWNIALNTFDYTLTQGTAHPGDGALPGIAVRDYFSDHGIVIRRYSVTVINMGVHPHTGAAGGVVLGDGARRGHKGFRVFGIDAAFNGVAFQYYLFLRKA